MGGIGESQSRKPNSALKILVTWCSLWNTIQCGSVRHNYNFDWINSHLDLVVFQVKMLKISSLSIGNQTFEIPCASAIECTLDGLQEDRDQCLPQIVKDYRVVAIVNIALVIIIGGLGNLFTIIAIFSARIR